MMKKLVPLLLGCLILLTACKKSGDADTAGPIAEAHVLTVLAGSELKDIEPLLPAVERATGHVESGGMST